MNHTRTSIAPWVFGVLLTFATGACETPPGSSGPLDDKSSSTVSLAQTMRGAPKHGTVSTDKLDYPPGTTVVITGKYWAPGETVRLVLTEEPKTHADRTWAVVANDEGTFKNTDFAPDEHDLGIKFTLTATGDQSKDVATLQFLDGHSAGGTGTPGDYSVTVANGATFTPGTTDIGLHCDDCTQLISLPFPIKVYDRTFTSTAVVDANGNIQFDSNDSNPFNTSVASPTMFRYTALPFWDDLVTDFPAGSGVFTSLTGTTPNRVFTVEWRASSLDTGGNVNFAVVFKEGSDAIEFIYGALDAANSATVAMFKNGSAWTQYVANEGGILTQGLKLTFAIATSNSPPVANAGADQTVECSGATTNATLSGSATDPDNDMPLTFAWTEGTMSLGSAATITAPFSFGSHIVTVTVRDPSGAEGSDTATVQVNDTVAPALSVPPAVNAFTGAATCSANVADGVLTATANDTCTGLVTPSRSGVPAGNEFPLGTTVVTHSAVDGHSNTASGTQNVTVVDNVAPAISCPGAVTQGNDSGTCGAIVSSMATGTDNCGATTIGGTRSDGQSLAVAFPVGSTTISWTARDSANNQAGCDQTITIVDNQNPTIVCPANIMVGTAPNACSASVALGTATSSDNCNGQVTVTPVRSDSQAAGSPFMLGLTSVVWTAQDPSGLTATCTQTVKVTDTQAPVISLPANITVPTTLAGTCSSGPVSFAATVTDNCPGATVATDVASGSVFAFGATNVAATATDASGNTASGQFSVTVSKVAAVSAATVSPGSQQYSDLVNVSASIQPGSCAGAGQAAGTVAFALDGTAMGTDGLDPSGSTLVGGLSGVPMTNAPGAHTVTATFGSVSANFIVTDASAGLTITQEDARVFYTGATSASTLAASNPSAVVHLSATVKDITAVSAATDPSAGDIRKATLRFVDRGAGNATLCSTTVALVAAGNTMTGTGHCHWTATVPGSTRTVTVGIVVEGYYTRDAAADNQVVVISRADADDSASGGGTIIASASAGSKAADAGTKIDFDFNLDVSRGSRGITGPMKITFVSGGRTYLVTAERAERSLDVSNIGRMGTAVFDGAADLTDITDRRRPVLITDNADLKVTMSDAPGGDSLGITLISTTGGLLFSSNWNGTQTVDQQVSRGRISLR